MPTNTPTPTNTPAPVSTPGVNPLNGFGIVNAMMNPTNYFNPNANYFSQSTPQQVAGPTPTTPADRQAALASVRQTVNKIDPSGAVGAIGKVGGAAVAKFAPSVVQIVNKNSKSFLRIPEGQLPVFHSLIDATSPKGIAGITNQYGDIYHLTAPSTYNDVVKKMLAEGFKDLGVATPDMIPRLVKNHARTNTKNGVIQHMRFLK